MNPVPADVRELMFKVKKKQGTDISRSFCGLNDHRNLRRSVKFAKKGGMISQVALSITNSPVHTVEYYMGIVDKVVEMAPTRMPQGIWRESAVRPPRRADTRHQEEIPSYSCPVPRPLASGLLPCLDA